jgi:hypothetical protein
MDLFGVPQERIEAPPAAVLGEPVAATPPRRRKSDILQDPHLLEAERAAIIAAVDSAQLTNIERRVAWLLNRYPEARDSDARLWRLYWETFDQDVLSGEYVHLDQLSQITPPTSLTRARAQIQNVLGLFLASPEIRGRRGTLSDEEKAHFQALPQRQLFPTIAAYADEAGKTEDHLVVGMAWYLHGPDQLVAMRAIQDLAKAYGFESELHFKEIDDRRLPFYVSVVDAVLSGTSTIAFTSGNVVRRGHRNTDEVLREIYYQVAMRSIRHHHETGRARLPRSLILIKDAENAGPDQVLLANLGDRLEQASASLFGAALGIDRLGSDDSEQNVLIQLADLYTSSVSRVLNRTGKPGPKDEFAEYFLKRLGQPIQPDAEQIGDLSVHLRLT